MKNGWGLKTHFENFKFLVFCYKFHAILKKCDKKNKMYLLFVCSTDGNCLTKAMLEKLACLSSVSRHDSLGF